MRKFLLMCIASLFWTGIAFAQDRTITGKVVDETNAPVPGVNIAVKGTTRGTTTDASGNYSISVLNSDQTLIFSFVGYKTSQETIGSKSIISVGLSPDNQTLGEVIITAQFGLKKQAKELGYSATSISSKELTQAKAVNVAQSLNGKVSGVNISTTNSGVFENSKIIIRGIRSLTGNNQPMLVLDGAQVPLEALSLISPDDIEDMTILKSASSAALYGPDAVNGVMIVTTRKGTNNDNPSVSITSSFQATKVSFFPKLQHEFGQGTGGVADQYGNFGHTPYENQLYGPRFDGSIKDIGKRLEDGTIQSGSYNNSHQKDKKKFYNTGSTFQNSVSIAGKDYFISFVDASIKGLMPDDKNRRTTFRFNGQKKINKFSIDYGIGYSLQSSNTVYEQGLQGLFAGSYSGSVAFAVLQTADNIPLLDYKDWKSGNGKYSNYYNEYAPNPYWVIGNLRSIRKSDNLFGVVTLGYDIAPWLKATARVSVSKANLRTDNSQAPLEVTEFALSRNSTTFFNAKGSINNGISNNSLINADYFLNGKKNIISNLSVSYLVGGNYREITSKDVSFQSNNLVIPSLSNPSAAGGPAVVPDYGGLGVLAPGNFNILFKRASVYGTLGFGYRDWAFVEFTGRNDWDSRLSAANRSFFYPSANLSLVISDAIPAIKNGSLISYLKLRSAISKSANVNVGPYSLNATYSQPAGFPFGSNAGYSANNTLFNPNLKPENVLSREVGIELGLLNGKIDFEATYFDQKCTNQILDITLPGSSGFTIQKDNAASFNNKGIEMDLGIAPYKIGRGKISFKFNATYNTSEITYVPGTPPTPIITGGSNGFTQRSASSPVANNIAIIGGPAFQFQLSDYVRDPATGKVVVDKVTGYPSQSPNLIVMGRNLPLWILGFTPKYTLGGFSAAMTWDYKGGHQFYSGLGSDMDFSGISARSAQYGRQRFVFPNSVYVGADGKYVDNTNIQVQDGNLGFWTGGNYNTSIATNYFASAAALRLREVNISYSLPSKWISQTKFIKTVTISLIGRNLFLFVPKSNQWGDPEFNYNSAGGNSAIGGSASNNTFGLASSFQTPAGRLFGGALNITF